MVIRKYNQELIDLVWNKGRIISGYPADQVRKDACGAWMIKTHYGNRESIFGWEIDHIYPEKKLQAKGVPQDLIDNVDNLRPLNWKNNISKGTDYPVYHANVKSEEGRNVECDEEMKVNEPTQKKISSLFSEFNI